MSYITVALYSRCQAVYTKNGFLEDVLQYCQYFRRRSTYCLSVMSENAALSRSRLTSSSDHPFRLLSASSCRRFFLFIHRFTQRMTKHSTSCADSKTRMEIFPGRYPGASFGRNVSVPTMFATQKAARVSAFTVTFFVWPDVFDALYA